MNNNNLENVLSKDYQSFCKWVSCLSLLGVFNSICISLSQFLTNKQWSIYLIIYSLIPLVFFSMIYFIAYLYTKWKFNYSIPFLNKKIRKFVFLLFIIYLGMNIALWGLNKEVEYEDVSLTELQGIISSNSSIDFFVLFGSRNCIYCKQMDDIYKSAFFHQDMTIYYVDLSYVKTDDKFVQENTITELPLLVHYSGGKEVERIVGVASAEQLAEFIDTN